MAALNFNPTTTYTGSCHCGFIKYQCTLDLETPHPATKAILTKCNCTWCFKNGSLLASPGELTVLSPLAPDTELTTYLFHNKTTKHQFCPKCGIECFFGGTLVSAGKTIQYYRVNVLTLDGRADGRPLEDLRKIKVMYWDGRKAGGGSAKGMGSEPWEGGVW